MDWHGQGRRLELAIWHCVQLRMSKTAQNKKNHAQYSSDIMKRPQKFETISHLIWHLLSKCQIKREIVSKFVAFLENLNFNNLPIVYGSLRFEFWPTNQPYNCVAILSFARCHLVRQAELVVSKKQTLQFFNIALLWRIVFVRFLKEFDDIINWFWDLLTFSYDLVLDDIWQNLPLCMPFAAVLSAIPSCCSCATSNSESEESVVWKLTPSIKRKDVVGQIQFLL